MSIVVFLCDFLSLVFMNVVILVLFMFANYLLINGEGKLKDIETLCFIVRGWTEARQP